MDSRPSQSPKLYPPKRAMVGKGPHAYAAAMHEQHVAKAADALIPRTKDHLRHAALERVVIGKLLRDSVRGSRYHVIAEALRRGNGWPEIALAQDSTITESYERFARAADAKIIVLERGQEDPEFGRHDPLTVEEKIAENRDNLQRATDALSAVQGRSFAAADFVGFERPATHRQTQSAADQAHADVRELAGAYMNVFVPYALVAADREHPDAIARIDPLHVLALSEALAQEAEGYILSDTIDALRAGASWKEIAIAHTDWGGGPRPMVPGIDAVKAAFEASLEASPIVLEPALAHEARSLATAAPAQSRDVGL